MHEHIGGHRLGDVEFVAAFDVDGAKVGRDLSRPSTRAGPPPCATSRCPTRA
ncbi:hypothetical protein NKH77_43680 [Streptomyces sp. M19]